MTRRLRARVYVRDDLGRLQLFGPDEDVPDWAAAKIRNPGVWSEDPQPAPAPPSPAPAPTAAAMEPPPRSGKGSGRAAWAAYAAGAGVQVDSTLDRDGIIAAVLDAGLPA